MPFCLQGIPEHRLQSKLWVSCADKMVELGSSDYDIKSNAMPQRPTDWSVLEPALLPAVRTCLLPRSVTGWHSPADACIQAEPICEALSLYHLLLSRDGKQGGNVTGLSPSSLHFGREGHADVLVLAGLCQLRKDTPLHNCAMLIRRPSVQRETDTCTLETAHSTWASQPLHRQMHVVLLARIASMHHR